MANIRSAQKRSRQAPKRYMRNRDLRTRARTAVKKARVLIESGDPGAQEAIVAAERALDKAASKGVIHPNNASRRKSRLMLALNKAD